MRWSNSKVGLGLALIGAADWSAATGFYVPQQTAYATGRANAGNVAMADEASTVFFIPAGMTRLDGAEVLWGLSIVKPSDRFGHRGTTLSAPGTGDTPSAVVGGSGSDPGTPTPVASLFYVQPIGDSWRFGIGVAAPFGLRLEYDSDWFGWSRFDELRIEYANGSPDVALPQGYRDTYTVSAGAEHRWRDDLTLRAGVQYDRTPTVDRYRNTSLPDADGVWTAVGVSYRPLPRMELSLSYQQAFFDDPKIGYTRDVFTGRPVAGTVRTRAGADAQVDTLSFAIRYWL